MKPTSCLLIVLSTSLFMLSISDAYAESKPFIVTIEQIKPDHGFYTDEDVVRMDITVLNNSTERLFVSYTGEQIFLGMGVNFRQDIEPNHFTLEPGTNNVTRMVLDKRWEGQWELIVTAEGIQNTTRYSDSDVTYYVLHPVSDKFNKEIADASLQAAQSASAGADYAKWGAVVSALALVGTIATIGIEYAKERNRRLAEWRKQHQLHSQQIMQVFSKCINELSLAHIDYKDGQLKVDNPYCESENYLPPEAKEHIKKNYKNIWKPYADLKKDSEQNKKDIIETLSGTDKPSFENVIVKKIKEKCPTLKRVKEEGQALDSYVDRVVFKLIFELKEIDKTGYPGVPLTSRPADGKTLMKYGNMVVSHCDPAIAKELDQVIHDLLGDAEIRRLYKRYYDLKGEWTKIYQKLQNLKNPVHNLLEAMNKGKSLEGYPACKECPTK